MHAFAFDAYMAHSPLPPAPALFASATHPSSAAGLPEGATGHDSRHAATSHSTSDSTSNPHAASAGSARAMHAPMSTASGTPVGVVRTGAQVVLLSEPAQHCTH